jgi:hypothetical protein
MNKPIIGLDFDGVIHDYKHGWQDGRIYGEPTVGFFEWAQSAFPLFQLIIHSSRAKTREGRDAMMAWLIEKAEAQGYSAVAGMFTIAAEKPPAFITIDDRAIRFDGDWSAPQLYPPQIKLFKPWMADS